MDPLISISTYVIIASLVWVGFLSVMFLISGNKETLCAKARVFLICKLILCIIWIGGAVLFLFGVNLDVLVPILAIWIIMWMVMTTVLNYRKEKEKGF